MDSEDFEDVVQDDDAEYSDEDLRKFDDAYYASVNAHHRNRPVAHYGERSITVTAECVSDTTPGMLTRELQRFAAMLQGLSAEEMLACLDRGQNEIAFNVSTPDGQATFVIHALHNEHVRRVTEQDLIPAVRRDGVGRAYGRHQWTRGNDAR
jgi:hypothetical protein